MDGLSSWFDLNGQASVIGPASSSELPLVQQLLLYFVVVAGVVLSEAVAMARSGAPIRIDVSRAWLIVACVVALVVFPAVWHEIGTMDEASLLVQMGVAAQGGVFWGVLVAGAEKQVRGRELADPEGTSRDR
jgi:hypothetical protein